MSMTVAERSRRYRERNPGVQKRNTERYFAKSPSARPLTRKKNALKRKYGITLEQYEIMLVDQGGVCAICGGPHVGTGDAYHVDHDHQTGGVRGLLCGTCNTGLGQFKDSSAVMEKAISYLRKFGK